MPHTWISDLATQSYGRKAKDDAGTDAHIVLLLVDVVGQAGDEEFRFEGSDG